MAMAPGLYAAFVLTTVLLAVFPGPNMALIVSNSVAYGTRYGLLTLVGSGVGLVIQLTLVAAGMSMLLTVVGQAFAVLRWVGAAYLVYLGVRAWMAAPPVLAGGARPRQPVRAMMLRGLLVTLSNPKVLLFFGAFFPQFIAPARPLAPQLALLSVTFVVVMLGCDSVWAVLAGRARVWISAKGRMINRVTGGLLVGAGLGLAWAGGK